MNPFFTISCVRVQPFLIADFRIRKRRNDGRYFKNFVNKQKGLKNSDELQISYIFYHKVIVSFTVLYYYYMNSETRLLLGKSSR